MKSTWMNAHEHMCEDMVRRCLTLVDHQLCVHIGMPDTGRFIKYLREELPHGYRVTLATPTHGGEARVLSRTRDYMKTRHSRYIIYPYSKPCMLVTFNAQPLIFSPDTPYTVQIRFNDQTEGYLPIEEDRALLRRLIGMWEGQFAVHAGHANAEYLAATFTNQLTIPEKAIMCVREGGTHPIHVAYDTELADCRMDERGYIHYHDRRPYMERFSHYNFHQSKTPWLLASMNLMRVDHIGELLWEIEIPH